MGREAPLIEKMAVAYATEIEGLRAEIELWKVAAGEWETKAYDRAEKIEALEEQAKSYFAECLMEKAKIQELRAAMKLLGNLIGYIEGINDERDSVPLLMQVREIVSAALSEETK